MEDSIFFSSSLTVKVLTLQKRYKSEVKSQLESQLVRSVAYLRGNDR